ncbi:MAG: site-specific DNA-methyltransferase [Polyangiaceae bacterium]|nr:site-specific DNA-methyltransferase [Polyangiaceae bacterium]
MRTKNQPKPPRHPAAIAVTKPVAKVARQSQPAEPIEILSYRHDDQRKNNPEVGLVNPETDPEQPKTAWSYDPHVDPTLGFDIDRGKVERLVNDALASRDPEQMARVLEQFERQAFPHLLWAGKAERKSFEIDTVSLHVHERIDPASILNAVRQIKWDDPSTRPMQQIPLFSAAFENLPLRDAIDFYQHDKGWSNRLIAGDSLLVMNSLLQKEGMAGQVQMIYMDPPYGIRYGSNFQPFVGKRDVKDRKDEDLTREPESLKAFRDTWELGIHSYLGYLRDRLLLARELLHESGSIFVQISEENQHRVRNILDEVFGAENFCRLITVQKTGGQTSVLLPRVADYLLWYARCASQVKYRQLYFTKEVGIRDGSGRWYEHVEDTHGRRRRLLPQELANPSTLSGVGRAYKSDNLTSAASGPSTTVDFTVRGEVFHPGLNSHWKTSLQGMERLVQASRVSSARSSLEYVRFLDDFPASNVTSVWADVRGAVDKVYVVQTSQNVIERCVLMTTDPGELVLDPTCGSGTTAFVSEKWGRRWVTCDTSRVATTLAKQRLLTGSYDYFELRQPDKGIKSGFIYKTIPHVTLKSIAHNPEIDEHYEKLHPGIVKALEDLNSALRKSPPPAFAITEGGRKGQKLDFRSNESVTLPSGENIPAGELLEWEVPFDFPDNWPESARAPFDAFHSARILMQKRMDASIAAHADQEILYDQPLVAKDKLRISGPFTVEAVPFPTVLPMNESIIASHSDKFPEPDNTADTSANTSADTSVARSGPSSRHHQWRDELFKTGIRGKAGQIITFSSLENMADTRWIHVTGTLSDSGDRVVVSFGPEHGALEQRQVEQAMREAGDLFPRPKMIVFASFAIDPEAAKDIDATKGIVALKAHMNTDLLTDDLKKARATNESFWLIGQPDIDLRRRQDGLYEVEVHGFDYFDVAKNQVVSGGKSKIAVWLLDTDYDDRSLLPRQVFFPMAGAKDGWNRLRKDIRAELDESLLREFHGTVSLPFAAGLCRKIAVKVVDDRGIESLKIIRLDLLR